MTKFKHDEFAKDLLKAILEPYGLVQIDRVVTNELRKIDVFFPPEGAAPEDSTLQLFWKCAAQGASFEPFRSPVREHEVRSTMGKLFDVHAEMGREAHREDRKLPKTNELPQLWIITPTMSKEKLEDVNAIKGGEEWGHALPRDVT